MNVGFIQYRNVYAIETKDRNDYDDRDEENIFDYVFDPSDYIDGYSENRLGDGSYGDDSEDVNNPNKNRKGATGSIKDYKKSEVYKDDQAISNGYNDQSRPKSTSKDVKKFDNRSDFNLVVAGDFYCNDETEKTIENIITIDPELIITTGDHVKNVKSAKCWIEMSDELKDKMKIAIGNHDAESSKIFKEITDHHNMESPYYSHDFQNIHFISLSTEHPFEKGTKQYNFIKEDLKKTSNNTNIDWITVHQHKAIYSSKHDKEDAEDLRKTYHPLFEEFNVDMVFSSHNQYYERTYPLLYNYEDENGPLFIDKYNSTDNYYNNNRDGILFLTVGTGGDELHEIGDREDYYAIQKEEYGFLNLKLQNSGKTIIGEFHNNDNKIIDEFYFDKRHLDIFRSS